MIAPPADLSLEDFLLHHGNGAYELVQGQLQECPMPGGRHGEISALIAFYLMSFVQPRKLGHVLTNDSFIILQREPLTVRGPDVLFISRERLPVVPAGPLEISPEFVAEVKSPTDNLSDLQLKIHAFLAAGTIVGWIIDFENRTVQVHESGQPPRLLDENDILTLPTIMPGFRLSIRELFA